jgi:hypothetical protein
MPDQVPVSTPFLPGSPEYAAAITQPPPELREQSMAPSAGTLAPPLQAQDAQQAPPMQPAALPPRPPGTGVASQAPPSKSEFFRKMLGDFFYSVGTGLANRGSGPDADIRGAGAAIAALPNRDIQQQQMEIQRQQAEGLKAYHTAQATALQNRSELKDVPMIGSDGKPVMGSDGQPVMMKLPADQAEKYLQATGAAAIRGTATTAAADTRAGAATDVANINAKSRTDVANINAKNKVPNEIGLILKANAGDKEAAAAYQKLQEGRIQVRSSSVTMRPMNFYDPQLQRNVTMSAAEAERRQKDGEMLIQAGAVPSTTLLQMQRAQNAIPNAVDEVSKNLKAWDNEGDKAIFARVLKDVPHTGDTSTWLGNVLDQTLNEKLSPEGQNAVISLRRLNESLGTLRAISGLPSTTGSMMATAALLPGGTTPDSKFAKKQLEQIKTLVQQETGVPFLGGGNAAKDFAAKKAGGGSNYSPDNPFAPKQK